MIYFVSYVLGLVRENSENAISAADNLKTLSWMFCLHSAQLPFTTKSSPRKNNALRGGLK
jgi:hypothetical protein